MTNSLAIVGAGGHGRVVADAAELQGFNLIEFFDDDKTGTIGNWPIAGRYTDLISAPQTYDGVIVAIGSNQTRLDKFLQLATRGANVCSIVHPAATISNYAKIGAGTFVAAGAVVGIGASLGEANIVNTLASVDHDCVLGNGVHVAPGAHLAGGVSVGARTWIGIGSSIREYTKIGSDVVVGAGAAVVDEIKSGQRVVGIPAKPVKE